MRIYLLLLFVLGTVLNASAQVIISGETRDAKSKQAVAGVNVMLQDVQRRVMYGYSISNDKGEYSITYKGQADSLQVVVTGFNIKQQSHLIVARTQRIDFNIEYEEMKIREVTVLAKSVERQSDTIVYNVSSYANVTDRSIGDVLRKMPGISVATSGEVKYNGLAINKFYVEGMDMLEGRYGIATNNIQAKDIARVELYENHQPIKALKDLVDSDRAAINLRLKDSAKGAWNGTIQAGAGYKPWMWNGEASIMFFGRKFQTLNVYKTNNAGNDVARELTSFYGGFGSSSSMLGVHFPTTPNLAESRFLNNKIHTVSTNAITKLNDDLELTVNAHYAHDYQTAEGESRTIYYLPDNQLMTINERTTSSRKYDQTEASLQLRANTNKYYLREQLSFNGRWDDDSGIVNSNDETTNQYLKQPRISARNLFSYVRRWERWSLSVDSDTDYNNQQARLRILPMLYDDVIDTSEEYPNAEQTMYSQHFRSSNSISTAYTVSRWSFMLSARLNADIENMESELMATNDSYETLAASDQMKNDINWQRYDLILSPTIRYSAGDKLSANIGMPVDLFAISSKDYIRKDNLRRNNVALQPFVSLNATLLPELKFTGRASYFENYGGLYDSYAGYIMSDYRIISNRVSEQSKIARQSYSASLSYGNTLRALFGSINVSYWRQKSNLMYGVTYEGSLSRTTATLMDNYSSGYNIGGTLSKRFDIIASTFSLSGVYTNSSTEVLRQEVLMPLQSEMTTLGASVNTRFSKALRLNYTVDYVSSRSRVDGRSLSPIERVQQTATLDLIIRNKLICRVGGEHYFNSAIGGDDRNMFFLDAGITYKSKRVDYVLDMRNLMDVSSFSSASQSDITDYMYTYRLRPASVMFTVKFSLR